MKHKIITIHVSGGVVQGVDIPDNVKGIKVRVLDYDVQEEDDDRIVQTPEGQAWEAIY